MSNENDVNKAVVALKAEIDSLLDKVMAENFELSQKIDALERRIKSLEEKNE